MYRPLGLRNTPGHGADYTPCRATRAQALDGRPQVRTASLKQPPHARAPSRHRERRNIFPDDHRRPRPVPRQVRRRVCSPRYGEPHTQLCDHGLVLSTSPPPTRYFTLAWLCVDDPTAFSLSVPCISPHPPSDT